MYLFFDTETTGLPRNWKAPVTDTDNWPRMIQLAWILADENGKTVEQKNYIIKPEGFHIPQEASRVHGITTERALEEGVFLEKVLNEFNILIDEAKYLVAHNISFDEKIVGAELYRKQIPTRLFQKPRLCTMLSSVDYCKIPGYYGYKWPKLSELHMQLFGEDFEGAHDAAADIEATARCFWELKKKNIM